MKCNVCGKEITEESYIEGNDCYICSDCCASIGSIWAKSIGIEIYNPEQHEIEKTQPIMKPKQIKDFLDEYVIGQDEAKMRLAVAVYNHYKRLEQKTTNDGVEIQKANCLILGPSGSGKTLLAQSLAKMLNVPIAIVDATCLTEAGYVGDDVETVIQKLLQAADYNVARAEKGIIFIDEFDKIARKGGDNPSITRDVSGEGVQQALLKIIEGNVVGIAPKGGRKHPDQPLTQVNTKDILFICAGAFEGLDKRISQRLNMNQVGYNAPRKEDILDGKNLLSFVTTQDLRQFGLIPEIIGRLPVVTYTNELTREDLLAALTKPKNAIVKQYEKLLSMDNIKLKFDKAALEKIVDKTIESKIGARGLRHVMEDVMYKAMFSLPSSNKKTFKVTEKFVDEQLKQAA